MYLSVIFAPCCKIWSLFYHFITANTQVLAICVKTRYNVSCRREVSILNFKQIYQRYLLRPIIYLTAFRLMIAAIFALILVRFLKNGPAPNMVAGFLAVFFALLAYLVYLRMDGLRIPRVKYIRPKKKADPLRHASSMADYTDEDPGVSFEELEDNEKDFCSLMSNLISLAVCLAASFLA